jgi:hypothetical protein
MDAEKRNAIHEAGHFLVAYRYNPRRAVSIRLGSLQRKDSQTGVLYMAIGQTVTFDFENDIPGVLVAIRAGGLAAESLMYGESYRQVMSDSNVHWIIKTDIDNAKGDLIRHRIMSGPEDPTFPQWWQIGFSNATSMLIDGVRLLDAMADYCLANRDRDIPCAEIVKNVGL